LVNSCELLKASRSAFYDWFRRQSSLRRDKNERKTARIQEIFADSSGNYGSPRIYQKLKGDGETIGGNKVAKIMQEKGLRAKQRKAFRQTTINNPSDKKSPRKFKGEVEKVTGPNQVWVSDLAYLPTGSGFSYLVTVMDLFNREIKGWDVSDSMEATNTKNAFLVPLRRHSFVEPTIFSPKINNCFTLDTVSD
jgi:transposase InsO family protein